MSDKKEVKPAYPEVDVAFVHQSITIPSLAFVEKTLSAHKPTMKGMKMYWTPQGLRLELKGKVIMVPQANVTNAILVDEK